VVCTIVWSCTINDKDFQIKGVQSNPTLVAPLAAGNLAILDVLSDQDSANIKIKSDGLVYLSYDQQLASQDIRDFVKIDDVNNQGVVVPVPPATYPPNPNDQTSTVITKSVDMGITPEQLTEIAFKSGTMSYSMTLVPANNNFLYAVNLDIPEFISNTSGQPFSQQVSGTGSVQLSGYTFKSATANKFTLKLTLIIKKNSSSVTVLPGTNLNVNFSFKGMDFTYVKGFLGDQTVSLPAQTIDVQAFGNTLQNGASVSFAQPTIDLTVTNDYGVPLKITFTKIEARKQASGLTIQTNPTSPIPINAPAALGTSANTLVSISNVSAVVNFAPTQFYYQASARINGGLTSGNNFMADTSKLRVKMHVEIPIYGKASNILTSDTLDVDLGDLDQTKIDSATLKTSVTNELPLDANLQFILTDSKYKFIDSLLTSSQSAIVKGSSVDSNGELSAATVLNQSIKLQSQKISKIFQAKKIIVRAKFNTSKDASGNYVNVKFKSQYKVKMQLGLNVKMKLNATF